MYQQYEKRIQSQLGSLTQKYSNKITELEKRNKEYEGELKKFRENYAIEQQAKNILQGKMQKRRF